MPKFIRKGLDIMEIRTFGAGGRMEECRRVILESCDAFQFRRLFLLPIPTSRDKKLITGTDVGLSELAEEATLGDAVAGYDIPEGIKEKMALRGVWVYDGALDEELLIRNAEVTARGTLGYILTNFDRDITDMRLGIVGYGRIGSCLLRYLLYLGANVTVYTTRAKTALELCESGVAASTAFDGLCELDILINTAPARLLSDREEENLLSRGTVIDLASGRPFSESEGVVKLASVPEKFYPVSAGRIYAEGIMKFLSFGGGIC